MHIAPRQRQLNTLARQNRRQLMWRSLLSLLFHNCLIQAFPVFIFNGSSIVSSKTPSFAYLVKHVDLPNTFILCSSIKQARFDDISFYFVSGRDSSLVWMSMGFRTYSGATKLVLFLDQKVHRLGELQKPRLDFWYHICLAFESQKSRIEVAVNGELLGSVVERNTTNKPKTLNLTIGITKKRTQFQGSVANVQLFKGGDVRDFSSLPCKNRQSALLPWDPNN